MAATVEQVEGIGAVEFSVGRTGLIVAEATGWLAGREDWDDNPEGYGKTRDEAIGDLRNQIQRRAEMDARYKEWSDFGEELMDEDGVDSVKQARLVWALGLAAYQAAKDNGLLSDDDDEE